MKKTLLIAALGLFSTATFAQNSAKVLSGDAKLENKIATELNDKSSVEHLNQAFALLNRHQSLNSNKAGGAVNIRADYQGALFNLFGGSAAFSGGFITVFPDTAIVQEGTDGTNPSFFRPTNHGLIYAYDAKSELFGNDQTTGVENYFSFADQVNVDSIFTAGIYFLNNNTAINDRLRFDIVTGSWGSGALGTLTSNTLDVDDDGIDDNVSLATIRTTGSTSNGVPAYNVAGATTVFRTFTAPDSNGVQDFGVDVSGSNITIPANGGMGVLITYEPTPGSYSPNLDTVSLTAGTGNANIFRSLIFSNNISGDNNMYFLQFSVISSQFFNNNAVTGFIGEIERYRTTTGGGNAYLFAAHTTSARVNGTSTISVNELENNKGTFAIYPNPNNGDFSLKLDNFTGEDTYTITVMNILGQIVHEEVVTMENGVKNFSLSNLDKGMYLMNISSKNINTVERITIK